MVPVSGETGCERRARPPAPRVAPPHHHASALAGERSTLCWARVARHQFDSGSRRQARSRPGGGGRQSIGQSGSGRTRGEGKRKSAILIRIGRGPLEDIRRSGNRSIAPVGAGSTSHSTSGTGTRLASWLGDVLHTVGSARACWRA